MTSFVLTATVGSNLAHSETIKQDCFSMLLAVFEMATTTSEIYQNGKNTMYRSGPPFIA